MKNKKLHIFPMLGRLRHEDCEFEAILSYNSETLSHTENAEQDGTILNYQHWWGGN
jgi:hypothetical protein